MVKDCPRCKLVNPPSAQRCDCGYDFASGQVKATYLSEGDVERQADARLPAYVARDGLAAVGLLAITGINGLGACFIAIAVWVASLAGQAMQDQRWAYILSFGMACVVLDFVGRGMLRCSAIDTKRGTRFLALPVWVLGILACIIGAGLLLAEKF